MAKAQEIKEHMEVLGSDGQHVGTVDCMKDADKLTKSDPSGSRRPELPLRSFLREREIQRSFYRTLP